MFDKNAANSRVSDDEYRLDLYSVIKDVSQQWLSVVLLTLSAVLLSYVLFSIVRKPVYTVSSTVIVENAHEDTSINNLTEEDVNTNMKIAAESATKIVGVITSPELEKAVNDKLGQDSFSGSISAKALNNASIIEIQVNGPSPTTAYKELNAIIEYLIESSDDMLGGIKLIKVQSPSVKATPVNAGTNLKIAILFGILAFIGLCTLLAWWSSSKYTVRNKREVESKLGVELLAAITQDKKSGAGHLITDSAVNSVFAEEVRSLALRLMNEMQNDHQKTLLISGAVNGEGKSTISANVALAMAQMHRKVILVDMDFQNPSLARILNMQDGNFKDLTQYFESGGSGNKASSFDLNDFLVKVPGTEMSAVLNRKAAPQAVDKYAVEIAEMMELLKEEADFVIVDSASAAQVSDAEELSSVTDTSIVVVREHFAEVKDVNNTIEMLGGRDRVLGCVFNSVRNGGHYEG